MSEGTFGDDRKIDTEKYTAKRNPIYEIKGENRKLKNGYNNQKQALL